MNAIAQIALDQWQSRLAFARGQVRARCWSREEADARLMPWLAIALRAGAMPSEAETVVETYLRLNFTDSEARNLAADYLCDPADRRAELARARDAASAAALEVPTDAARADRSFALQSLAVHLGAPPYRGPLAGGPAQVQPMEIAA